MAEIFDFYVADNRTIKFNPIEPILQEDNGVAVWRFRIPKVLNNIDMSGFAWWFVYINAAKQKYSEPLTLTADADDPDNYCIADYTIDYGISLTPGSFTFALEAINANGSGEIIEEWHTKTYSHSVIGTLQGNQAEYSETESDIISALMVQIQEKYNALVGGATPIPVASISAMTDTSKIYLLTTDNNWYCYNGSTWVSGGLYASGIVIDPTLTQSGQAADAKVVGDEIEGRVSKPVSSPNGTAGQLLRTNGDGTTQWVDQGLPTDEQTAEAIDEWLTDHPEATTTVQDGAITEVKLANALKLKTIKDYVTPEMFGAVGDGTADDTQAIQSCLDYASEHKVSVICKNDYSVSTIVIKNGIPQFVSLGTIHGKGLSGENGIVRLGTNDDALKNCIVSVNIDMSNGDAYGLYGVDTELCTIADCRIYGAVEHATIKKYCIHLKKAKSNIIKDNYVEMVLYAAGAYQYGIVLMSDLTASYGGYFDSPYGSVVEADNPPKDNVLIGNTILNGTHSIVVNGGVRNVISNNVCKYPSHRGVALTMSCFYNLIANNQFHAYGSTGVIMGYGAEHNEIIGNVFSDDTNLFSPDGEGAITAYVGIKFNKITGNKIFSKRRYGIYVAIDAVENVIENNAISGYRLAGIALENDWVPVGSTITDRTLPTDAKYSRPNYGNEAFYNTDGEQVQYWSYSNTENNTIQGNHIKEGSGSNGAAIYVSQIGNRTKTTNNIIQNNVICPMSTGFYYLYVYENYENYLINNILKNNTFLGQAVGASKFHLPKWRKYFMEQKGNNFLDDADVRVSGSSISVGYGYLFRIINSSETTLTEITDGVHNQEILLRLDTHTTIKYNSATIRPKGLTDITPQSGNAFVRFRNVDGTWFEMSRNF